MTEDTVLEGSHLDENTADGTIFEFDDLKLALKENCGDGLCKFTGDIERVHEQYGAGLLHNEDETGDAVLIVGRKEWNDELAPHVSGVLNPANAEGDWSEMDHHEEEASDADWEGPEGWLGPAGPDGDDDKPAHPLIDDALARELFEAEQLAKRAEQEWEDAKEVAKSKKQNYEAAMKRVMNLLEDARTGLPLFQGGAAKANDEDTSWRAVKLLDLPGISEATLRLLEEAEIETVGELADYQGRGDDPWFRDIKGLGKEKAQTIDEALTTFWEQRAAGQEAEEPEEPSEEE